MLEDQPFDHTEDSNLEKYNDNSKFKSDSEQNLNMKKF